MSVSDPCTYPRGTCVHNEYQIVEEREPRARVRALTTRPFRLFGV